MIRRLGFALLCFLAHSLMLCAQEEKENVQIFSIEEAVEYAQANSLELNGLDLDVQLAKELLREYKSIGLPQVNANFDFSHFLQLPTTILPDEFGIDPMTGEVSPDFDSEVQFGTKNSLTGQIQASQMLFNGSYFVGLEAAKASVALEEKEIEKSSRDIRFSVIQAYYNALIVGLNTDLLEKNLETLEQLYFETTQLYENGFVEKLDIERLDLSKSNLKTQIDRSKRQELLMHKVLKFQMNYPIQEEIELSDEIARLEKEAGEVLLATEFDASKKTEYQILEQQSILNQLDLKNIKAQRYPNANVFASYQRSFQSNSLRVFNEPWFPTFVVGLNVSVPLFDGFRKDSQIKTRQLRELKLKDGREMLKNGFEMEVEQYKTEMISNMEALSSQTENLALAERIYETALIKYREGIGSSLEVNSAESALYQTQGLLVAALYDLVQAQTALQKALGK